MSEGLSLAEATSLLTEEVPANRKHPLAECEKCPLQKKRCVPSSGPANAEVAVVSRSPGRYDTKIPFSGPSGKVLNYLLELYNYRREDVLVTNVVLCENDGPPPTEAIKACRGRLRSEIDQARTIIAAGSEAVGELTGKKSLDGARGYVHERSGKRVIATNNPAIVLRDDSTFPNLVRDFKLALAPLPTPILPDVDWTNDVKEGRRWLQRITAQQFDNLSIDIESQGIRHDAPLVALGISATGNRSISFGQRVVQDEATFRDYIRPLLSDRRRKFLYHNGKFDVRNLRWKGVKARVDEDTMLLSWALDERSDENQVHRLEYLLMNELNWPNYEPPQVVKWKATVSRLEKKLRFQELYELPTPDELYQYNALDAAGTALLLPILTERAKEDGVYEVYRNFLIPFSEALVRVELQGADYDADRACDMLEEEVWPQLSDLRAKLQLIVGDGNYNPNSTQQNARLVYDEWKVLHNLPLKDPRTVDKSVYTEIAAGRFVISGYKRADDDIPRQKEETAKRWAVEFAEFKGLDKQRSTYLEGLIPRAVHDGNKLYTSFKLHNTVSGRLSSSGPNLQNITRTKPGLPNIRSLFVAPEGYTLVQADYSQAELRAIAAVSGDETLCKIYYDESDLHDVVASRFYGPSFTKEQRSNSKNMNFGVAYGQSAETFQEKHGIPVDEAEEFRKWWWAEFKGVRKWADEVSKQVMKGEVVSPLGYKRRFHLITKQNKNAAIREGINFIPQNLAGVFTEWALCHLVDDLDPSVAAVILTVHDSIVLRVRTEYLDSIDSRIIDRFEQAPGRLLNWTLPFKADVQHGTNWGELV